MTQVAIKEQLAAQKKTTEKAVESKEAAKNYLKSISVEKAQDDKKEKFSKPK